MSTSAINICCPYCGSPIPHRGICPSVKAFEYFPNGMIKRVEFKTASDYAPIPAAPTADAKGAGE